MITLLTSVLWGATISILLRDESLWVRVSVSGLAGLLIALLFPYLI